MLFTEVGCGGCNVASYVFKPSGSTPPSHSPPDLFHEKAEKLVLQEQSKNPIDIKEVHVDLSVGVQLQPFHELLYLFMESWCSVDVTVT